MNYIKKLQEDNEEKTLEISRLENIIADVRDYCLSDKFSCGDSLDGYVNIKDILLRLRGE